MRAPSGGAPVWPAKESIAGTSFNWCLDLLGSIFTTPGFTDEVIHLYPARDLEPASQALDADELLTVEPVPLPRAIEMCTRGELRDAKSMCTLHLAERRLR